MERIFTAFANRVSAFVGQPQAFVLALGAIILWGITGPVFGFSDTWQLVVNTSTTIVTFLIVFLIQNAQNRDAAALHAKLDELIRVGEARNEFIGIEHLTEHRLREIRDALEAEYGDPAEAAAHTATPRSIDRLLRRL